MTAIGGGRREARWVPEEGGGENNGPTEALQYCTYVVPVTANVFLFETEKSIWCALL